MALPFQPVPDGVEVSIRYLLSGIPCVNILGFEYVGSTGINLVNLGVLLGEVGNWLSTSLSTIQCNTVVYTDARAVDLTTSPGQTVDIPLSITGSLSATPVANQVNMSVTSLTGLTGRSQRGRWFLAGLPAAALQDAKTWKATETGNANIIFADLLSGLSTTDFIAAVVSRFHNGVRRSAGLLTPITGWRGNPGIVTQKRRLT